MMWRDRKSPPLVPATTADPAEIARFTALADAWWEPHGPFRTLHRLNPVRLAFIRDRVCRLMDRGSDADRLFAGLRVLDIGCGGGLLSEPVACWGAEVVGIDATARRVEVARTHAARVGAPVTYRHALAEANSPANTFCGCYPGDARLAPLHHPGGTGGGARPVRRVGRGTGGRWLQSVPQPLSHHC